MRSPARSVGTNIFIRPSPAEFHSRIVTIDTNRQADRLVAIETNPAVERDGEAFWGDLRGHSTPRTRPCIRFFSGSNAALASAYAFAPVTRIPSKAISPSVLPQITLCRRNPLDPRSRQPFSWSPESSGHSTLLRLRQVSITAIS